MKWYKYISIILSVMLVLSISTACVKKEDKVTDGGKDQSKVTEGTLAKTEGEKTVDKTSFPIVKDKTTLKIVATKRHDVKHFDEISLFKDLEEKTNVQIKWEVYPNEGWNEKKGLLFASDELPDAFYGTWTLDDSDVIKYGSQGMLIPLEDLIKEYAVNINKVINMDPTYSKSIVTPDGHIYALPSIDESSPKTSDAFFINQEWLNKVGKDIPKTTDDFYEVLKAFKEGGDLNGNGKNDEIPFTFRFNDLIRGVYSFFGSFGLADNRNHMVIDNDKVVFTAIQPEYKEAIKYFNKLFSEGLIDSEAFTQDAKIIEAKIKSKERVLGAFCAWSRHWAFGTTDVEYVPVVPLKGPNGHQSWNKRGGTLSSKSAFAITSYCKIPEVAIRWADCQYEPEFALQAYYGPFDVALKKNADGTVEQITPPEGKTVGDLRHEDAPGVSSVFALTRKGNLNNFKFGSSVIELDELDKVYEPYLKYELFPPMFFTVEETEELSILRTDIYDYVDQMYAKWVSNGGIDDEWDDYIKKLKDMKLDDMMKIYEGAYKRYKQGN
jgi:putative aldouronate transport system substrate-binding protein